MATDPQRQREGGPSLPEDAHLDALAASYDFAERAILAEILRTLQSGRLDRQTVAESLRTIDSILERLGKTDDLAERAVRTAADRSEADTGRLVQAIVSTPDAAPGVAFSRVNERAVRELVASMDGRLRDARRRIGREARDVYARESRKAVLQGLLGNQGSRRAVSNDLIQRLARQGVTGFTDKAGRRWGISRYAEMVARTTTREAVTAAAVGRMLASGITVSRVSRHGTKCPICAPLEGRLVGLVPGAVADGDARVWQPDELPGLTGMPPFHPQCRHTLVPEVLGLSAAREEAVGVAA